MIRHATRLAELKKAIRAESSKWFHEAEAALQALPKPPKSSDFDPLWSEIKQVYIRLQCSKCCFCEKDLEGKIEQDVEHFRPKTEVRPWALPARLQKAGVQLNQRSGAAPEPGYVQLAYHPLNYAMACKFCNEVLKRNYFPIAGTRRSGGLDPSAMKREKAYLIYPLGDHDDDPEDLIEFDGLAPKPKKTSGFAHYRALVVIELFKLDDKNERPILFSGRAFLLRLLFLELEGLKAASTSVAASQHQNAISSLTADGCPFANCMRSFQRLYQSNPAKARQYADECLKYIDTKSLRQALS